MKKNTKTVSPKKSSSKKCPPELLQLETVVGQFMEYWGFKSIHGRIWAHLFTSSIPLDSIELMSRLAVSKGLMSLALRDLVEYNVIKADHVGRHGSVYYIANSDLLSVISNVLLIRESKMLKQAQEAGESLKKLNGEKLKVHHIDTEKVQKVIELTDSAQLILRTFLEQDHASPYSLLFSQT